MAGTAHTMQYTQRLSGFHTEGDALGHPQNSQLVYQTARAAVQSLTNIAP